MRHATLHKSQMQIQERLGRRRKMSSKTRQVLESRLADGRRIKVLVDNLENEPEWFRKWILLRAGTQSHAM